MRTMSRKVIILGDSFEFYVKNEHITNDNHKFKLHLKLFLLKFISPR